MQVVAVNAKDFEGHAKVEAFQDAVAAICKLDFVPRDLDGFQSRTEIHVMPGLITGTGVHSASDAIRTTRLAAETDDNVMIHIPRAGGYTMQQKGGDLVDCKPGMVYIDPNEVVGHVRFYAELTDALYVSVPRAALRSVERQLGVAMRRGHDMSPQWRILLRYAEALHAEAESLPPHQRPQCVDHVRDLVLMALGATGDTAELAAGRGLRAARMRAILEDIEQYLQSPELAPGTIARRNGISERYLRDLFASRNTTFSDHVASRRLELVCRHLRDPAQAHRTISAIAYSCGFGDLSWFNVLFRRRFGRSPSDVRASGLD